MQIFTEPYTIKFSKQQKSSLKTLKKYDVNIPDFIRSAIKEKIQNEWANIKMEKENDYCPF
jgi:hypothetical protein